jgi:glycosyltransferase involved in cell wall biosynthesis
MNEPVSVIINVFNEVDTIEKEVRVIHEKIISKISGSELIIAEDGSNDGTHEIIGKLAKELPFVIHSTSVERKGYTRAFRDAVNIAKNPWVFFSDTGGKNDFEDFYKLYVLREGSDLVIGTRHGRTDQLYRQVLTWGYNKLLQLYFGLNTTDADSGFRLYKTSLLKTVANQQWVFKNLISSEIVIRLHYINAVIKETPVTYRQRKGESRGLPLRKIPNVIIDSIKKIPELKRIVKEHLIVRD